MKKPSILALSATVAIAPAFAETGVNYNTPSVDVQPAISLMYLNNLPYRLPHKLICLLPLVM